MTTRSMMSTNVLWPPPLNVLSPVLLPQRVRRRSLQSGTTRMQRQPSRLLEQQGDDDGNCQAILERSQQILLLGQERLRPIEHEQHDIGIGQSLPGSRIPPGLLRLRRSKRVSRYRLLCKPCKPTSENPDVGHPLYLPMQKVEKI